MTKTIKIIFAALTMLLIVNCTAAFAQTDSGVEKVPVTVTFYYISIPIELVDKPLSNGRKIYNGKNILEQGELQPFLDIANKNDSATFHSGTVVSKMGTEAIYRKIKQIPITRDVAYLAKRDFPGIIHKTEYMDVGIIFETNAGIIDETQNSVNFTLTYNTPGKITDVSSDTGYPNFEVTEISSTVLIDDGKTFTIGGVHSNIGFSKKDASNKKYAQIVAITSMREQTTSAALAKVNEKVIMLSFESVPFKLAMDSISEKCKINIVMTANSKERLKDTMVNLKLHSKVSIKDFLRFVCLEAGVNTYIIDKNGNVIIE